LGPDDTIDFARDTLPGESARDHVGDVGALLLRAGAVELEGSVVGEPASYAGEGLRVVIELLAKGGPPHICSCPFALPATEAPMDFPFDYTADLEGSSGPVLMAVLAPNEFSRELIQHGHSFHDSARELG
jgi:hypothetical protein